MAPKNNKEAIILAIDIGKNSLQQDSDEKTYFEKALFCASMILKRKLFTESKDDIALILFGSSHTNNPLSSQGSHFKNIEIVTNLGVVTWDLLQHITNLSATDKTPSDWLSTLIIATDMLKNENDDKIFTDLQIVMFSNFTTDISFDKIDSITRCIQYLNINLTMIGIDCEDISCNSTLEKFINETKAVAIDFKSVLHQLSYCKPKEVIPRAWNVALSFGNVFNIKVSGYKKVDEVPKGFKWLLCHKCDTEDSITGLQKHTSYCYVENEVNKEVDYDCIINGFRFGDTIIPVSDIDTDAFGYKSGPKSLQVLGFTKAKNIQRSFLMDGGSYIFKPEKEDFIAFGAIFKAMVEREEIMVVRKVYSVNTLPNIGALFPQNEDNENYFVYVNLPYADDEHLFKLPSLKSFKPNDDQKNAVRNLISAMDLDNDEDELFMPENTYNPELQYMYHCIAQKAINKNKLLVKDIPENIHKLLRPPKRIVENAKESVTEIKQLFSLLPKIDEKCAMKDNVFVKLKHNDVVEFQKPCVITELNSVNDFNKLLEDGVDPEIVCHTMKKLTIDLISSSISLEELKKPALNLKTLRQFCIYNKDVHFYNELMYLVKDSVVLSGKEKIWSQFIDSGIGLITNQEVEMSSISQEISDEFMKYEAEEDILTDFIIDDDDPLKEFL